MFRILGIFWIFSDFEFCQVEKKQKFYKQNLNSEIVSISSKKYIYWTDMWINNEKM